MSNTTGADQASAGLFWKIGLVAGLLVAIGAVLLLKGSEKAAPTEAPAEAAPLATATVLPRLLELGADKCIPCKMMAPIIEELEKEYAGRLKVEFIDVWKYPEKAEPYAISIIPTQIFFDKEGQERFRHTGFFSKEEILAKWKSLGVELDPAS